MCTPGALQHREALDELYYLLDTPLPLMVGGSWWLFVPQFLPCQAPQVLHSLPGEVLKV